MTDDGPKIIPFGKYKGRLLDEVLADDPAYLQWLAGQDWFRAKFNILHQVIINRGAEPEETPDHNAMQVKFLDDEFCLRFVRYLKPTLDTDVNAKLTAARNKNLEIIDEEIESTRRYLQAKQEAIERHKDKEDWHQRQLQENYSRLKDKLLCLLCARKKLSAPIVVDFTVSTGFEEHGVDVDLEISVRSDLHHIPDSIWHVGRIGMSGSRWHGMHWDASFKIEIKPVVGDDYPAVLRQMKRTGADVLFVGEYTGQGATEKQFVQTMATAGIRVVFAREVEG
jgi:uncharacterized protein (DUF3820 family)